jgi:hypothetical protein
MIVFDEAAYLDGDEVWHEVLRPSLARRAASKTGSTASTSKDRTAQSLTISHGSCHHGPTPTSIPSRSRRQNKTCPSSIFAASLEQSLSPQRVRSCDPSGSSRLRLMSLPWAAQCQWAST